MPVDPAQSKQDAAAASVPVGVGAIVGGGIAADIGDVDLPTPSAGAAHDTAPGPAAPSIGKTGATGTDPVPTPFVGKPPSSGPPPILKDPYLVGPQPTAPPPPTSVDVPEPEGPVPVVGDPYVDTLNPEEAEVKPGAATTIGLTPEDEAQMYI
ncbi:hypothetical protein WJX72_004045 [[Myrmecia] bisecta]|uniref:Uncharacterized protein n=1 Tax=[Myrmecia] bisecta TaxID=41462 RepID=A0AAW1PT47_9CHLO